MSPIRLALALCLSACTGPTLLVKDDTATSTEDSAVGTGDCVAAPEICDGKDNDCDGGIDNEPINPGTWYRDADGDGFGSDGDTAQGCTPPSGYVATGGDCDDASRTTHPSGVELCDGVDNDCNGLVDDSPSGTSTYYRDEDGDGYGSSSSPVTGCEQPEGYTVYSGDCDDENRAVSPAAAESCNGIDDNCDGAVDNNTGSTWYPDADADGYGSPRGGTRACTQPAGTVADRSDCDDEDPATHPGATEVLNDGVDQDCDGTVE